MKRNLIIFCLCITAVIFFAKNYGQATEITAPVSVYHIDRRLFRLVPIEYIPHSEKRSEIAREIISEILTKGSENSEILPLLSSATEGISVRLKNDTAFIDIKPCLLEFSAKNAETERLIIYQLVNSLTTIEGVTKVEFSLCGKKEKSFLGFLDMRDIFTPEYDL